MSVLRLIQRLPPPVSPISLPHLIYPASSVVEGGSSSEEPEDILLASLSLLDPTAAANQHGDPGDVVIYNSRDRGPLLLHLSDPSSETECRLFAHYVWNAGLLLAECIGRGWWYAQIPSNTRTSAADWKLEGEIVLELGAGSGLVSLVAANESPSKLTITDYPIYRILQKLRKNLSENGLAEFKKQETVQDMCEANGKGLNASVQISIQGHEWGCFNNDWAAVNSGMFTRIIAADTLWMDTVHSALASSMAYFLGKSASSRVWIVAGFHTGREKVRKFLEDTLPQVNLELFSVWEVDIAGNEREWDGRRHEGPGEGARWCVVAVVGWNGDLVEDSSIRSE